MNDNPTEKFRGKKEFAEWMTSLNPDFFVTLTFNEPDSPTQCDGALRHWHNCICKKIYGPKWHKKPANERFDMIAVIEKIGSNPHWHALIRFHSDIPNDFAQEAENQWAKIKGTQDARIDSVPSMPDAWCISNYLSKEVWKAENYENFYINY